MHTDKVCIITGGNSGIGKSAAARFAQAGATVILACRNMDSADVARREITAKSGNDRVYPLRADLSLLSSVNAFVQAFRQQYGRLDVLVNNAADFDLSQKNPVLTADGLETKFVTNHLAPFSMTLQLLDLLKQSPNGKIINIASKGLLLYPSLNIEFDNLKGENHFSPVWAYYHSKLAQIIFTCELSRRLAGTSVAANCIRVPGVAVDLSRYQNLSRLKKRMYQIKSKFSLTPDQMAEAYFRLAFEKNGSGAYLDENLQPVKSPKPSCDPFLARKLWDVSRELTGLDLDI